MPKGVLNLSDKDAYYVVVFINQDSHYCTIKLNHQNDFKDPKVHVLDHDKKVLIVQMASIFSLMLARGTWITKLDHTVES